MAYNRGTAGEELVPVVKAILRAAEEIDFGSEYCLGGGEGAGESVDGEDDSNANEVVEGEQSTQEGIVGRSRKTGGSWRLLLDQHNHARWSPLHLVYVQGGTTVGKVPLTKALLQMDGNNTQEDEETIQHRMCLLTLLDRQNRNILHHLSDILISRDDNFEAAHFILSMMPSLLFQKDDREKTPFMYVLQRLMASRGTRGGHLLQNNEAGRRNSYRMLKLLVSYMERETRRLGFEEEVEREAETEGIDSSTNEVQVESIAAINATENHEIANNDIISPRNILHTACRLPRHLCPSDGSLLVFLSSPEASFLEYGNDSLAKLAEEQDEDGNYALHFLLSNESYAADAKVPPQTKTDDVDANNRANDPSTTQTADIVSQIVLQLTASYPRAVSTPNNNGKLPLQLAMNHGIRNAISILVKEYPEAVLLDSTLENIKYYVYVLACITLPISKRDDQEAGRMKENNNALQPNADHSSNENGIESMQRDDDLVSFTTLYDLLRSRPNVVSFGGAEFLKQNTGSEHVESDEKIIGKRRRLSTKLPWWKMVISFRRQT